MPGGTDTGPARDSSTEVGMLSFTLAHPSMEVANVIPAMPGPEDRGSCQNHTCGASESRAQSTTAGKSEIVKLLRQSHRGLHPLKGRGGPFAGISM